jgi:hypothetical protein
MQSSQPMLHDMIIIVLNMKQNQRTSRREREHNNELESTQLGNMTKGPEEAKLKRK